MKRAEWSKAVEARTLSLHDERLPSAIAAYERLSMGQKFQLATELADSRCSEFCRAYKNVVMLAAAYKETRSPPGQTGVNVSRVPSVVFVVRRKWSKSPSANNASQMLPMYLFSYFDVEGKRLLCAVPTDVVLEKGYSTGKAHAAPAVKTSDAHFDVTGTMTCAATVTYDGHSTRLAMSCQHVLSPTQWTTDPTPTVGCSVVLSDSPAVAGTTTGRGGQVRADQYPSFDVQFAEMDGDALNRAIGGLKLSKDYPYVRNSVELGDLSSHTGFLILVSPANSKRNSGRSWINVNLSGLIPNSQSIQYEFLTPNRLEAILPVNHLLLAKFIINDTELTIQGDSGSPVVLQYGNGECTLIAMHIAGGTENGYAFSYGIPAWQLFDADQYSNLPNGASVTP